MNDTGKKTSMLQSKSKHASLLSSKGSIHFEKTCSDPDKVVYFLYFSFIIFQMYISCVVVTYDFV